MEIWKKLLRAQFFLICLIIVFLCGKLSAEIDLTKYFSKEELLKNGKFIILWIEKDESSFIRHYATYGTKSGWLEYKLVPYDYTETGKTISNPPYKCKDSYSCLLVITSYPFSCSLSHFEECAKIIIPYSEKALLERYKGQVTFLNSEEHLRTKTTDTTVLLSPTDTNDTNKDIIEKGDIYRIFNNHIYFVNSAINSIQVIDITDKINPKLVTSYKFEKNKIPKELFYINDFIYLISDNQYDCEIDVLKYTGNSIISIDKIKLQGNYHKSMRRNDNIYLFLSQITTNPVLYVLKAQSSGKLDRIHTELVDGTNTFINLSSSYLIISSQAYLSTSLVTKLNIYALLDTEKGIRKIGDIILSGRIPSDRHINIDDSKGLLRVVYYNQQTLSTNVGIYDLRKGLLTGQVELLGEIKDIAKGESLHGAVFSDNRIYLVTYLMKDPLFVIDTSNPRNPKILGQLIVPGWNEQLVFNNNLIFGIGYDDQVYGEKDSQWARRVSATLFDVSNPEKPTLLSRITPFAGDPGVSFTTSDALNDERVYFVNWNNGLTAFPFYTYLYGSRNYVQAIRIDNNSLTDLGKIELPVHIKRVLTNNDAGNIIFALGEQELNILSTDSGTLNLLSSLELARIFSWIGYNLQNNSIIVGSRGSSGIYKLFNVDTSLNKFDTLHNLATSFNNGIFSSQYLLFYNTHNNQIQLISLKDNKITNIIKFDDKYGINLYIEPLINGNKLYIFSQRYDQKIKPSQNTITYMNYLHELEIDVINSLLIQKSHYQIPGIPLGFNAEGELLTYENTIKSGLRINILSLKDKYVILKNYKEVDCSYYNKSILVDNTERANSIYLYCGKEIDYRDPILLNDIKSDENVNNLRQKIMPPIIPNIGLLYVLDPIKLDERIRLTNIKDRLNLIKGHENYLVLQKNNLNWYCPPGQICIMNEPIGKVILPDINEYWLTKITKDGLSYSVKFDNFITRQQLLFLEDKLFYVNDASEISVINLK